MREPQTFGQMINQETEFKNDPLDKIAGELSGNNKYEIEQDIRKYLNEIKERSDILLENLDGTSHYWQFEEIKRCLINIKNLGYYRAVYINNESIDSVADKNSVSKQTIQKACRHIKSIYNV